MVRFLLQAIALRLPTGQGPVTLGTWTAGAGLMSVLPLRARINHGSCADVRERGVL